MAGLFAIIFRFRIEPAVTVMGNVNWLHFPVGAMNPMTLGGMSIGVWISVVPLVDPKYVRSRTEVEVRVVSPAVV